MNTRKVSNLKYQFGKYAPNLTVDGLQDRLVKRGLIVLLDGGRYAETPKMRAIPRDEFETSLREALAEDGP